MESFTGKEEIMMYKETVHKPAAEVTGFAIRTSNLKEGGPDGLIPSMWERYLQSGMQHRNDLKDPPFLYALYTEYENDVNGSYTVLLGHELEHPVTEEGLQTAFIPEAEYMVFTSSPGPMQQVVPQLWQEIWSFFQSKETERAYTGDFELYDLRGFHPDQVVVNIYIAVKRKAE